MMTWVRWVNRGAWRRGGTTVYTKHATATTSSSARKHASSTSRAFMAADVWGSRLLGGGSLVQKSSFRGRRTDRDPGFRFLSSRDTVSVSQVTCPTCDGPKTLVTGGKLLQCVLCSFCVTYVRAGWFVLKGFMKVTSNGHPRVQQSTMFI